MSVCVCVCLCVCVCVLEHAVCDRKVSVLFHQGSALCFYLMS